MGTEYAIKPRDLYAFEADLPSRHGHAGTKPSKAAAGIKSCERQVPVGITVVDGGRNASFASQAVHGGVLVIRVD